jgi:MFS family permease
MTDSDRPTPEPAPTSGALAPQPGASSVRSPGVILAVVGFSVFVAADDLTVVSTMLRPIIGDLGLVLPDGLDDAAWVVNAYLIAFVAVMPLAGRLSDVLGRRATFTVAWLLFLIGTIVIPLSTELDAFADHRFGWFLTGRVLTAIGGGAMVPVAMAVVGDAYPVGLRSRALGTLGAIETLGWVWGPLYGAVLVRLLSWQWQFWLNVPLAIGGLAACWWALGGHGRPIERPRIDWLGAALLTITLVALNVALLGSAEIQSVTGLDQLTGGGGRDTTWLFPVAAAAAIGFCVAEWWALRGGRDPLFDPRLFRLGSRSGRNLLVALAVNFAVGAGLVIAMVDVPLFVNAVEVDLERSAVVSGAILSALTAAMAIASYVGGRLTQSSWYRPPLLAGVALATAAYLWMGLTWDADAPYALFALQLALLGAGLGLTVAPVTSAVVDHAPPDQRGAAAGLVMVVRLLGLSVGLSALTAWGLARFNDLRATLVLPPIGTPGFEDALRAAQADLTGQAIAETFVAAAVVLGAALLTTAVMRRTAAPTGDTAMAHDTSSGDLVTDATPTDELATDDLEPVALADRADIVDTLMAELADARRRTNLLVGALGLLLLGALACIAMLFGRVADARDEAAAAQAVAVGADTPTGVSPDVQAELDALRADIERVEAGAALYASQLAGYQELFADAGPGIAAGVDEAIAGLREFGSSTLSFEFPLEQTVTVPIKTEIPIDQSFDTTIEIETPLGFSVPVDVTVPVDVVVPVDLEIDIPVDETVPVEIDVSQTELAALTDSLATGLESLSEVLDGLAEPPASGD